MKIISRFFLIVLLSVVNAGADETIDLDAFLASIPQPKQEESGLCKNKVTTDKAYLECLEEKVKQDPSVKNINFLAGVYMVKKDLHKAIETFKINADKGDKEAIYKMAGIINEGLKEHQRAFALFAKIKDYKDSTCQMGGILSVVKDEDAWYSFATKYLAKRRTLNFYDDEIAKGNIKAYECKGLYYISLGEWDDYKKVVALYQTAIDKGDKDALFLMGQLYSLYYSNHVKAEKFYRLSIAEGNAMAARNLGNHYARRSGKGEMQKAIPLFMKAVQLGDVKTSLFSLGSVYALSEQFEKAEKVWIRAGELGNKHGYSAIGSMYLNNKMYKKAEEKFRFCINKGNLDCYAYLGGLYEYQYNNLDKAIEIFKEGYAAGSMIAANNLGVLYKNKLNNFEEAKKWFLKAIAGGYSGSAFNLGHYYDYTLNDEKRAMKWYKKAYEIGGCSEGGDSGCDRAKEILTARGEMK